MGLADIKRTLNGMDRFFLSGLGSITEAESAITWDAAMLRGEIAKRSGYYAAHGIKGGDRVVIVHGNNNRFFADLFALWCLGCGVACLDADVGALEFEGLIGQTGAIAAIVNDKVPERLVGRGPGFLDTRDADNWSGDTTIPARRNLDDPCLVLFTSGSTGLPKGVMHSVRTLQTKWMILRQQVPIELCRNTLCPLPTHFGHGLICNALYPLVHGQHVVILPKSDISWLARLAEVIDRYGITFMSSVPTVWRVVLRVCKPPANGTLRQANIGSAPLSAELWEQVQRWTGTRRIWNAYGVTEVGSWVAGPISGDAEAIPADGLVGHGWGAEILISSLTDIGDVGSGALEKIRCSVGEKGYVWLRTPCVMLGYLNRPEQTAEVLQGSWFLTGDIGYIDDAGRLVLTGRARNEINKGGIKISPEELDLLVEKHPDIAEACSFAVDDPVLGQNVAICVVFADRREAPSVSDLKRWSAANLSAYKVPVKWYSVSAIPKTSRGKIKRDDVAAYCSGLKALA